MQFKKARSTRWSLRNQFVVPLGATIVLVSSVITAVSWRAVTTATERDTLQKLENVYQRCIDANYPMTASVLKQISKFSGIDIAFLGTDHSIRASTLEISDEELLRPVLDTAAGSLSRVALSKGVYDATWHELNPTAARKDFSSIVLMLDQAERRSASQRALWTPAITGILSVLAIALVSTVIATRIANRIERLEGQVNRIAGGNFEVIEMPGPEDALARFSRSVNVMSKQLELAHDRISKSERSRLISMIASGIAHQLRNSLTGAILCMQSFLRSHPHLESEELSMALVQLKLAQESIRRLLASNSDSELADYADLSIGEIHHALHSYVIKYAEHHHVAFEIESDSENSPCVIRQGAAIVGALLNLIMNAIEATGSGGKVRCVLQAKMSEQTSEAIWQWSIEDDGAGPNEDVLKSMMEPFVTTKPEGVGLGLPMAKRIAKQLGGTLEWRRSDKRTVFELCIPKGQSA